MARLSKEKILEERIARNKYLQELARRMRCGEDVREEMDVLTKIERIRVHDSVKDYDPNSTLKSKNQAPNQNYIASFETHDILARLSTAIKDSGHSLRGLERESERLNLADHETLRHGNLSRSLRGVDGRNLYLQTFLAICQLIGRHPATILAHDAAGLAAEVADALSHEDAEIWLKQGLALLEAANSRASLQQRLQSHLRSSRSPATSAKPET